MFEEISIEVNEYLSSLSEFKSVMERNGKVFLFPIVASFGTEFPFSTYVLGERIPETKDKSQIVVTLDFWFNVEQYDACCRFTDTISDLIEDRYILLSSSIEFNAEATTFTGVINFNII